MLQTYLCSWAEELDEAAFRVRLRGECDRDANRNFADSPTDAEPDSERAVAVALRARFRAMNLKIQRGARVLDVCSGRGLLADVVRRSFGARVSCVDLSAAQVAQGRERARNRHGLPSACVGDVLSLPYMNASFDVVAGHSFLHHVPDVPRALAEMRRVLRPGGVLALLHEPGLHANFWESFPLSLIRDTRVTSSFTDLWLFTPADLSRLLSEAGFVEVAVVGTGLLSAVVVNWYLILCSKTHGRLTPSPIYRMRARLNQLEARLTGTRLASHAPSLLVTARTSDAAR